MTSAIMPTYYFRLPVAFEHGQGAWLWDTEGKQYLDALSGIAVTGLGHAHPAVTAAICEQAGKLIHTSNTFQIPLQEALATELTRLSGMEQAFFCNSGGEATETAIKLSRMFARKKNIENPQIIVMEKAFHGRSMGSLAASNERIRDGFEPLLPGFLRVPYNDISALQELAKQHCDIVAIMLEPIQGESGINVASEKYLKEIRALCDQNDWLMILDEVQTGLGRTGKWFAYQHCEILPDVITIAKSLGNGIPIGSCLARGKACNLFTPGKHGSTFGGNPLACATALAVLRTIEQQNLVQNAATMGEYLLEGLKETLNQQKAVIEARGKGLMIGIELDRPCRDLMATALKHGLLFNITANQVIRLLPPLIINREEADKIIKRLATAIEDFVKNS